MSKRHVHELREHRLYNRRPVAPFDLSEFDLNEHLSESTITVGTLDMNRLHAQALEMDYEIDELAVQQAFDDLDKQHEQDAEEAYYEALDREAGYHVDHWIPWVQDVMGCREVFGGTDFIIIHNFRSKR